MTLFDLLFILIFLTTVAAILRAVYLLLRGRRANALGVFRRLGLLLAVYLGVLILVSLVTPRRVLLIGDVLCFDDWCIAVEQAMRATAVGQEPGAVHPRGEFYVVKLRISSRALRVSQRELHTHPYLLDTEGHAYDPSLEAQAAYESVAGPGKPLSTRIGPGESFTTDLIFDPPAGARVLGFALGRTGVNPGLFVIGDGSSLFHKQTVIRLDAAR